DCRASPAPVFDSESDAACLSHGGAHQPHTYTEAEPPERISYTVVERCTSGRVEWHIADESCELPIGALLRDDATVAVIQRQQASERASCHRNSVLDASQ